MPARRLLCTLILLACGHIALADSTVDALTAKANSGDAAAQFDLGTLYMNGDGVQKDVQTAIDWYTKAGNQGDPDAEFNLGVMYDNGIGVAQDQKRAIDWYTKAARQGDKDAQARLAQMYFQGEGVAEDDKRAYQWIYLAASGLSAESPPQKNRAMLADKIGQSTARELEKTAGQLIQAKPAATPTPAPATSTSTTSTTSTATPTTPTASKMPAVLSSTVDHSNTEERSSSASTGRTVLTIPQEEVAAAANAEAEASQRNAAPAPEEASSPSLAYRITSAFSRDKKPTPSAPANTDTAPAADTTALAPDTHIEASQPTEPEPVVSKPEPVVSKPAPVPVSTPSQPASTSHSTPAASTGKNTRWAVQVSTGSSQANADVLVRKLKAKGFNAFSSKSKTTRGTYLIQVLVGPNGDKDSAIRSSQAVDKAMGTQSMVVPFGR